MGVHTSIHLYHIFIKLQIHDGHSGKQIWNDGCFERNAHRKTWWFLLHGFCVSNYTAHRWLHGNRREDTYILRPPHIAVDLAPAISWPNPWLVLFPGKLVRKHSASSAFDNHRAISLRWDRSSETEKKHVVENEGFVQKYGITTMSDSTLPKKWLGTRCVNCLGFTENSFCCQVVLMGCSFSASRFFRALYQICSSSLHASLNTAIL